MKKGIFIVLISVYITACSDNYTGQYEYKFTTKKVSYVNPKTGKERSNDQAFLSYLSGNKNKIKYKKVIKEIDSKFILELKQNDTRITGDMTLSNKFNVAKFNIESGEVDKNNLLHLKLVKSNPIGSAGVSASIFSLSLPMKNRFQINFNQVGLMKKNELIFKVSTISNIPLFGNSDKNEKIVFVKR